MMKTKPLKDEQPDHGTQSGALVVIPYSAHSGEYSISQETSKDLLIWYAGHGCNTIPRPQVGMVNMPIAVNLPSVRDQSWLLKLQPLAPQPSGKSFNYGLHNLIDKLTSLVVKKNAPVQKAQSLSCATAPDDTFVDAAFNLELHDIAREVDSGRFFKKTPAKERKATVHALPMWPSTLKKEPYTI